MMLKKFRIFILMILPLLLLAIFLTGPVYARAGGKGKGGHHQHKDGPIDWGWGNNSWTHNYYGRPSFRLRQDRKLRRAMKDAQAEKRILNQKTREVRPLQRQLRQQKTRKQKLTKNIEVIDRQITTLKQNIKELRQRIQQAKAKIPQLQRKVTLLNNQIHTKQARKKTVHRQLQQLKSKAQALNQKMTAARQAINSAMQSCTAKGQTQEQCKGDPAVFSAKQKYRQLMQSKANIATERKRLATVIRSLEREIVQTKTQKQQAQKNLTQAQNLATNGSTQIGQKQNRLSQKQTEQQNLNQERTQVETKIGNIQSRLRPLLAEVTAQQHQVDSAIRHARNVRRKLIDRIHSANYRGYNEGDQQGRQAGGALAHHLGTDRGQQDGGDDGHHQGTQDGQARDYQNGYREGEVIGTKEANTQGEVDGKALGRDQGNTAAGRQQGTLDGIQRAEASDAHTIGQQQGTQDGMNRAVQDGKQQGSSIGEKQAIDQYENKALKPITLDGPFAGTFGHNIPPYPGVAPPQHSCEWFFRQVVRQACHDGLEFGYYRAAEMAYHHNVGNSYNQAYGNAYSAAHQQALSTYYESSYLSGKETGRNDQFSHLYPQVKETFRQEVKAKFEANPDQQSQQYRQAFASATGTAYDKRYEAIRFQNFSAATQETYAQNIDEQIARFTQIRRQEVVGIYQNHSIIEYISSTNQDVGIRGVAKNDGIYQPEETILHDIIIKNYGLKPARNVQVRLASGEQAVLPQLPGQSLVTVKGGAKSHVTAALGNKGQTGLVLLNKQFNSTDHRIEGRHFYNAATGQINAEDKKTFQVKYPIVVTRVAVKGDLLLGEEATYNVEVENRSKRNYLGPIEVRVETSLGSDVLTSSLPSINQLQQGQILDQGRLLVDRENDALEQLTFNVVLAKNGVVLGQIHKAGAKLVQIQYRAKENAPVLLGNAQQDVQTLLDLMSSLGGVEQTSILDLALKQDHLLNNGALSHKIIQVAKREIGPGMSHALEQIIKSAKGSIIVADPKNEHLAAILAINSLKFSVRQVMLASGLPEQELSFVNQHAHPAAQEVIIAESSDLKSVQKLTAAFLKSDEQLMTDALRVLDENKVLEILESKVITAEYKAPIQILLGKILLNALKTHQVFSISKKQGKSLVKKTKKDPNDLLNKTLAELKQSISNEEVEVSKIINGIILLEELEHQLSKHKILRKMKGRIKRSMISRSRKLLPKLLRKLRKQASSGFYRKFIKNDSNRLKGNFQPIKEITTNDDD